MMNDKSTDADIIIVGAGLSGLACAARLHEAGLRVIILEASERVGGRIKSVHDPETGTYRADLGPTWVWPPYQPAVTDALGWLTLDTYAQYDTGDGIVDLNPDSPVQRHPIPGQHGMCRIIGGPQALIDALSHRLPPQFVRTGHTVIAIEVHSGGVEVATSNPTTPKLKAKSVVVAVPPRIAAQNIGWSPDLPPAVVAELEKTPTWMAAQAKALMLYERPFWRELGLSGRVASRVGPLFEIHDHCGPDGETAALFGFIGWPHNTRQWEAEALRAQIEQQLIRCFGPAGGGFTALYIEDWADNPNICADLDSSLPAAHPEVTDTILRETHHEGRMFFCVAETASESPGLIDGALSIATQTANRILTQDA